MHQTVTKASPNRPNDQSEGNEKQELLKKDRLAKIRIFFTL